MLGISGSPVKNSNTDRLVKTVLEATGLDYDDWHLIENKIKECAALIIGGYPTYGTLDSAFNLGPGEKESADVNNQV